MSSLLLDRVLGLHIQFSSHLITIIGKQIVVERFHVTSNGATDTRGMGRKDGTDLGQLVVDIECTQSAHPLISMIDDLLRQVEIMVVEALHHKGCGIREH